MIRNLDSDYCIIGAGIAGLLVASRLTKAGHKVLVLDQGPDITEQDRAALLAESKREFLNYSIDYNSHLEENVVTPTTGATIDRLFGTGGTALHFEGFMIRPVEADHQVQTLFGYGRDWPVSLKELEPWLFEAEQETGVTGNPDNIYAAPRSNPFPMQGHDFSWFDKKFFGPALEKLGMKGHSCPRAIASRAYQYQDFAVRQPCGGCRFCKFCPTGARYSPDRVHGAWLKTQPNATIRNGISLRRLELSSDGSRIVAAHAKEIDGGKDVVIKAEHFVLATGGVAMPHMLLLSKGPGPHSQGIGNASGQVGVGYSGHSYSNIQLELNNHVGGRLGFETMICEYGRKNVDRTKESSWFLTGMPTSPYTPGGSIAVPWATDGDQLSLARLREALPRMADFLVFNELSGTGTVDLDPQKTDVFGDPVARINMPFTDWDRTADVRARELADKLGEQLGALNTTVGDAVCWHDHPSGATAIGTNSDDGVCDTNLKVFGVDNLYLVGSSVFPHMGANPPTLTISALALRLASHLEGK